MSVVYSSPWGTIVSTLQYQFSLPTDFSQDIMITTLMPAEFSSLCVPALSGIKSSVRWQLMRFWCFTSVLWWYKSCCHYPAFHHKEIVGCTCIGLWKISKQKWGLFFVFLSLKQSEKTRYSSKTKMDPTLCKIYVVWEKSVENPIKQRYRIL